MITHLSCLFYLDVICGRGSRANNHIGNIRFRQMVKHYQGIYRSAYCKADKPLVALEIVVKLKAMSPPGRFLTKPPRAGGRAAGVVAEPDHHDYWIEVDKFVAMRKVAQRLREDNALPSTIGEAAAARHRRAPTTTITTMKTEKATSSILLLPQEITVSHESDDEAQHNDDWGTPIVVSDHVVQPAHDDDKEMTALFSSSISSIIDSDKDDEEEEVEVEQDRPAGVATEDRDPDAISNSTILWHEDHVRVALGLVDDMTDDMPTAATLLGLLGDDF
jgi:hypothetical protein